MCPCRGGRPNHSLGQAREFRDGGVVWIGRVDDDEGLSVRIIRKALDRPITQDAGERGVNHESEKSRYEAESVCQREGRILNQRKKNPPPTTRG